MVITLRIFDGTKTRKPQTMNYNSIFLKTKFTSIKHALSHIMTYAAEHSTFAIHYSSTATYYTIMLHLRLLPSVLIMQCSRPIKQCTILTAHLNGIGSQNIYIYLFFRIRLLEYAFVIHFSHDLPLNISQNNSS